jgi:serine/threonine-protein kinase
VTPWQTITISEKDWTFGRSLGSGGFGEVYSAESHGQWAAIKLVPKDPGARRELLLADNLRRATNVLPVYGVGETETHWALLMPMAEQTLRQYLIEAGGPIREDEALPILTDLARALVSLVATGVIHRDLKPENVLLYQGTWCLTDFGISRYADATTETDTRKYSTARPYAAPEQWRDETATVATDIYALGVVSHELLTGSRPFRGPDFRHQHLHEDPPVITSATPPLAALVEQCLFKAPGARPSPQDLLNRLETRAAGEPASRGLGALQAANQRATSQLARVARSKSTARSESERRFELTHAAEQQFERISAELKQAILSAAPASTLVKVRGPHWQLTLGTSALQISNMFLVQDRPSPEHSVLGWSDPSALSFDTIACAHVAVGGRRNHRGYVGRAHSLWFCDAQEPGRYRWYETAFVHRSRTSFDPQRCFVDYFFLDDRSTDGLYIPLAASVWETIASEALDPSNDSGFVAWPFTLLEPNHLDEFIDRWANWLAAASEGRLEAPSLAQDAAPPRSWRHEVSHRPGTTSSTNANLKPEQFVDAGNTKTAAALSGRVDQVTRMIQQGRPGSCEVILNMSADAIHQVIIELQVRGVISETALEIKRLGSLLSLRNALAQRVELHVYPVVTYPDTAVVVRYDYGARITPTVLAVAKTQTAAFGQDRRGVIEISSALRSLLQARALEKLTPADPRLAIGLREELPRHGTIQAPAFEWTVTMPDGQQARQRISEDELFRLDHPEDPALVARDERLEAERNDYVLREISRRQKEEQERRKRTEAAVFETIWHDAHAEHARRERLAAEEQAAEKARSDKEAHEATRARVRAAKAAYKASLGQAPGETETPTP